VPHLSSSSLSYLIRPHPYQHTPPPFHIRIPCGFPYSVIVCSFLAFFCILPVILYPSELVWAESSYLIPTYLTT
jgi:hypothetical protein